MIRVSELKQTEINIVFYEEERERRDGDKGHWVGGRWDTGKDSQKGKYLKMERMRQTRGREIARRKKNRIGLRLLQAKCCCQETLNAGMSWISVKFTLSSLHWPWQHTVFRSTAACFIIDSSPIHASLKFINFLKQPWIDETDWKLKNFMWIFYNRCMF